MGPWFLVGETFGLQIHLPELKVSKLKDLWPILPQVKQVGLQNNLFLDSENLGEGFCNNPPGYFCGSVNILFGWPFA